MSPIRSRPVLQLAPGEAQHVPTSRPPFLEMLVPRHRGSAAHTALTHLLFKVGKHATWLCAHINIFAGFFGHLTKFVK